MALTPDVCRGIDDVEKSIAQEITDDRLARNIKLKQPVQAAIVIKPIVGVTGRRSPKFIEEGRQYIDIL